MWLLALLLGTRALALTDDRSGVSVDLAVGGSVAAPPVSGAGSAYASVGWWDGVYDHSYAIGRYWSANLGARVDLATEGAPAVAPAVEVRRGIDLVVAGWYFGFAAGPALTPGRPNALGAGARATFGAEFRRTRFWGLTLRAEAGADARGGRVRPAGALLLGAQFSRPLDGQGVD